MVGRIVVLVSGSGSNMRALVDACRAREVPGDVVAVAGDRPCRALAVAASLGVDSFLVAFRDHPSRDAWSVALRDRVEAYDPDLVVSAGFMRILGADFVDAFEGRLINLHPSLLPSFPGVHAVRDALEAGVDETGTTVHLVDRAVDSGPILLQRRVPVLTGDTEETLHARIKQAEHDMLPEACRLLLERRTVSRS